MAGKLKRCFRRFLKRTGIRRGLIAGVLILLLVDLLWVGSAALSRIIYTQESYNKPFFSTYFKTSLFSIYLSAFIFWRPWQRLCVKGCRQKKCEAVRVCSCEEGVMCVCGLREDQERKPLLSDDSGSHDDNTQTNHTQSNDSLTDLSPLNIDDPTTENTPLLSMPTSSQYSESLPSITVTELYTSARVKQKPISTVSDGLRQQLSTLREDGWAGSDSNGDQLTSSVSTSKGEGVINESAGNERAGDGPDITQTDSSLPVEDDNTLTCQTAPSQESTDPSHTWLPIQSLNPPNLGSEETMSPLTHYLSEGSVVSANRLTFRPPAKLDSCPINPDLKVCLLGPPEYQPLGCYEEDSSSEDEHKPTEPLSPCHDKSCKVRFKPTVEVREMTGEVVSVRRKLFKRFQQPKKEKWKRQEPLPVWKVAILAIVFGVVWFFANYLYSQALTTTSVGVVNTLSSTSGVFVMALAALPCLSVTEGDKITLSRCIVTLISFGGATLVSLSPSGDENHQQEAATFSPGALFALGGSILYAVYLVLLRRVVTDHDALDIPMFFGFVGLFDSVLLLPLLVVWHYTDIETFDLPPTAEVWTLLLVNGFLGTVLSELLWLWGVFLTSPLLGTLALSLVTPLSVAYSIVFGKAVFSWLFVGGAVMVVLSFLGVTVLDHYGQWDPLWAVLKKLFLKARDYRYHRGFRSLSAESRSLIINHSPTNYCQDIIPPS